MTPEKAFERKVFKNTPPVICWIAQPDKFILQENTYIYDASFIDYVEDTPTNANYM